MKKNDSRSGKSIAKLQPEPSNKFVIRTFKKVTMAQRNILFLLGCNVDDCRVFITELTDVQAERLKAEPWVSALAPETFAHY